MYPQIVVEVARSQSEQSLVGNARDWLVGTQGHTNRAIIFNIEESNSVSPSESPEPESSTDEETYPKLLENSSSLANSHVGQLTVSYQQWYDAAAKDIAIHQKKRYLIRNGTPVEPPKSYSSARPYHSITFSRSEFNLPPNQNSLPNEITLDLFPLLDKIREAREVDAVAKEIKAKMRRKLMDGGETWKDRNWK